MMVRTECRSKGAARLFCFLSFLMKEVREDMEETAGAEALSPRNKGGNAE